MELPSHYIVDRENIKSNAYRLICCFYASKEIARTSDPENRNEGIALLENQLFFKEVSRLLLEIAISVRVMDDQMNQLPNSSEVKTLYLKSLGRVNQNFNCMMFDNMNLRDVCNKIIHAIVVEPHFQELSDGDHEIDHYNWMSWCESSEYSGNKEIPEPDPITWKHLTNNIRLGGKHRGEQWWHLLVVPTFVESVSELLS